MSLRQREEIQKMLRKINPAPFLCGLSSALLVVSFPKTDFSFLGWMALIPLMSALDAKTFRQAFGLSYLSGILFFGGTLFWVIHVTALGAVLLVLYLALYFGVFGLGYRFFSGQKFLVRLSVLPSLWTVLEFIRAHFLTGFGWASLGHSQYKNLAMIQIADLAGVYGVSFLMVMVNVCLKEILPVVFLRRRFCREIFLGMIIVVFACFSVLAYGISRLRSFEKTASPVSETSRGNQGVTIAVVQANTPQEMKWEEPAWPVIMEQYLRLTKEAAGQKPDLIIWPETSYPGILWEDEDLFGRLRDFIRRLGVPLLLGSVVKEGEDYYNSAILLSGSGEIVQQYRKVHLVPFGEYIPLRRFLPFLSQIVPIADFASGREYTVFPVDPEKTVMKAQGHFSVLICFEDTVAELSRAFVRHGAQLLVNITNDAWFEDTKAPFLHLQSSVFRTIENRRSLVRAANTGVSCFVAPSGRITGGVEDENRKKTYVRGFAVETMTLNDQETFYTKFGDVFAFVCLGYILGMFIFLFRKHSKKKTNLGL